MKKWKKLTIFLFADKDEKTELRAQRIIEKWEEKDTQEKNKNWDIKVIL
jgi:hypothetical protein